MFVFTRFLDKEGAEGSTVIIFKLRKVKGMRLATAFVALALLICREIAFGQGFNAGPGSRQVEIRRARTMKPLKVGSVTIIRLIDSVVLEHDGVELYCDSAYVYQENNSFDAYGSVRIDGEGSLITGSALYYEGDTKNGRIVGTPVSMLDKASSTQMWTDFLFFNTEYNTAHFLTGGRVESVDYRVLSRRGYYTSSPSRTTFSQEVVIRGDGVEVLSDSVELYRATGELRFFTRTRIHQDSVFLYGDRGNYDQKSKLLRVASNVSLKRDKDFLFADYVEFHQNTGYALARGRAVSLDSGGDTRLYGRHLEVWQKEGRALATDSPLSYGIDTSSFPADTVLLRADTLLAWREAVRRFDSLGQEAVDSIRHMKALHAVRAFSRGQQLVADSIFFNGQDSTVSMYRTPVPYLWMNDMQAYGKSIIGFLGENRLDSVHLLGDVFVAQQDGMHTYNQINGQAMSAWLDAKGLRFVRVRQDGKVIFFMRDNGKLVGVNKVEAPAFNVWLQNNTIRDVTFYTKPKSEVIPYRDAVLEDKKLPGFSWNDSLRPKGYVEIIPNWITDLTYYQARRDSIAFWEAFDSIILSIPWESGTSKIPSFSSPSTDYGTTMKKTASPSTGEAVLEERSQ